MTDKPVVHIGENSPEQVAYRLMTDVANIEDKLLYKSKDHHEKVADRKWILDTYAECLKATTGRRMSQS